MPYHSAKEKAQQQYEAAYHLLHVTFPLVRDPKLLMGVINNLFASMEYSMDTILKYERQLRLVPHHLDNFQSKFNIFRYKSVRRNQIPQEHINLMMKLKELIELHKKSPMVFQRGNRYVICTKGYEMHVLSIKGIKRYLELAKDFLEIAGRVTRTEGSSSENVRFVDNYSSQ